MTPEPGPTGPTPTRPGNPRPTAPPRPRIPTWLLLNAIHGVAWVLAGLLLILAYQGVELGYLGCDCDGTAIHPGITFRYVAPEGMGSK